MLRFGFLIRTKKLKPRTIGEETRNYRNREKEILFMDLRQMGVPFEKKYTQFSEEDIKKITGTYHNGRSKFERLKNIPEFCYAASFDEVAKKDFSLVPSKYIEFVNRDENIDFDEKMKTLQVRICQTYSKPKPIPKMIY